MVENIIVYESVKRWMRKLQAGSASLHFEESSTYRAGLYWLKQFCNYHKTNPDSLILDRKGTMKSIKEEDQRKHEEMVEDFIIHMRRDGKAPNTINTAIGLIRSFYADNYVDLKKVDTVKGGTVRHSRTPIPEDIRKMAKIAELPAKTWLLSQKDCGLANVDLFLLRYETLSSEYGTIKTQLKKGTCPIHIEVKRGKNSERVDTFLGPNAIEALQEYSQNATTGKLFRFAPRSIQFWIKGLGIKAKVATRQVPITPYSLRRFFNTRMKAVANVNSDIVELWMGHSIGKVRGGYLNIGSDVVSGLPISELAKKYMDAYWAIDIRLGAEANKMELSEEMLNQYNKAKIEGFSGSMSDFINQAIIMAYNKKA